MRLAKFALCNRMGVTELVDLLSLSDTVGTSNSSASDLRYISRWDQDALAEILEISLGDIQSSFCCVVPRHLLARASTELRYCEPCLTMGFHAAWFQWMHIERCPLHGAHIRRGCYHCSSPIPYELGASLALSPLCCTTCGRDWVPSLTRPGGRCLPLGSTAAQLMQRWSEYVQQVVTIDHHLGRDRDTGQFVAARVHSGTASVRPHVLTMMNRLFDSPPPVPTWAWETPPLEKAKHETRPVWPTNSATSASRHLRFGPEYWPHFGSDFIRYEVMVLAARDHLFETDGHEFAREQQHRLLLDGLLAPTNLIGRDTAAAIGWAVSWLGPSQALAPPTGFAAPASGLTGWLTYLPLRSPHISVRDWRVQVSRWLVEDLAHSACMWAEVAEFMSTRGHYLLYAEAVHPISLAIRHRVIQN